MQNYSIKFLISFTSSLSFYMLSAPQFFERAMEKLTFTTAVSSSNGKGSIDVVNDIFFD